MLPHLAAIPLQTTNTSNDSGQNINRLLPVGQNVSATVVAVSRDQVQPEIFRLKLEVNNRLIQMGVFQALPIGQKINVNRQSDGQIQITPQPQQAAARSEGSQQNTNQQQNITSSNNSGTTNTAPANLPKLKLASGESAAKIPNDGRVSAAVISSRPVYTGTTPITNTQVQTSPQAATPQATPIQPTAAHASGVLTTGTENAAKPAISTQPLIQVQPQTTTSSQPTASQSNPQQNQQLQGSTVTSNVTQSSQTAGTTPPQVSANTQGNIQTINPGNTTQPNIPSPQPASSQPIQSTLAAQTTTNQQTSAQQAPAQQSSSSQQQQPQTTPSGGQSASTAVQNQPHRPVGSASHHVVSLALPDGSKVEVTSPKPLPQGTQLQFEKGPGQELQIIRLREPPLTQTSALDKPAIQEVLRNVLPTQIPTGNAFNQLAASAAADTPQATQISGVVRSMLQLFGVRPGSPDASSQIKNNVEMGGYTTERTLSKGLPPQPQEMRSQLNQLQQLANKLPEEQRERFEQLLRGIHSRVTSQQLNSLQQWRELPDGGFERVLQFDLPIKQGEHWENLELRLSREGGTNTAGEMVSVWRVRLHFDLEELGGVDAEIRLTDGHEISTLFWCEQPETAERLRQRSEEFSERLRMCGFDSTEVSWHEGAAPEQQQVIHKQLVDLHT